MTPDKKHRESELVVSEVKVINLWACQFSGTLRLRPAQTSDDVLTPVIPKSEYDAKVYELESDVRRSDHFRRLVEDRNFDLSKAVVSKDAEISALKKEVETLTKQMVLDVTQKYHILRSKREHHLESALWNAIEAMSATLEDMQHYFENKCVPTLDELNRFCVAESLARLAFGKSLGGKALKGDNDGVGNG